MTQTLTLIAVLIIALAATPLYLAGMLLSKIGLVIMAPAKALADFGMKLIEEQQQRERAAKQDDI